MNLKINNFHYIQINLKNNIHIIIGYRIVLILPTKNENKEKMNITIL